MKVNPKFHALGARKAVAEINAEVHAKAIPAQVGDVNGDIKTRVHAPRVDVGVAVAINRTVGLADGIRLGRAAAKPRLVNAPLVAATPAKGNRVDSRGRVVFYR